MPVPCHPRRQLDPSPMSEPSWGGGFNDQAMTREGRVKQRLLRGGAAPQTGVKRPPIPIRRRMRIGT